MEQAKEKWYRREHIGVTEKSNPLFPVYFQHVCNAKFPEGTVIAKCLSKDKEVLKANAKLIVVAPELLEACKLFVESKGSKTMGYYADDQVRAIELMKQAIKNAE